MIISFDSHLWITSLAERQPEEAGALAAEAYEDHVASRKFEFLGFSYPNMKAVVHAWSFMLVPELKIDSTGTIDRTNIMNRPQWLFRS